MVAVVNGDLTPEEKATARDLFEDGKACHFCAGLHDRVASLEPQMQPCPRIKRIERHTDGTTVLVLEFWPPGRWEADVLFPGDVYDDFDS